MTARNTTDLAEREKKARIILDRAYDAYIEIDINNAIVDWNTRAEITFGWTQEEVIGKNFTEIIIPTRYREAQRKDLAHIQRQAKLETPISNKQIEIIALRRDGKEFPAEMTVFPVETGRAINLGTFIRNISGRKIAEQAMTESENTFRLMVSGVSDYAIIMLDPQGIVKTWNEGAQRIEGYNTNEIIGQSFSCFYTNQDQTIGRPKEMLDTAIKFGRCEEDGQRIRKDGSEFLANVVINPIYDHNNNLIGFANVTRDIGEWKATNQHFHRLLDLAPDAMVVVNQLGNIILANLKTENIFGYSREELLHLKVDELIPQHSKFIEPSNKKPRSKGLELYALRKDGTEFPIEISLSPLETEQGLLVSTTIRDITERKQFESDLREQKELFQIILDSLADGVIVADSKGKFLVINRAARNMIGINYKDIPVDKWSETYGLYLPDTTTLYPTHDLPLVRAIRGETVVDLEMFIRNALIPLGAWLSVNGAPIEIKEGTNVSIIVFHDVTKHKITARKNARLAAIVESSDDSITGSDLDGTIINWNNAATKMFEYAEDQAVGQSDLIIVPADRLEEETVIIRELIEEGITKHYETIRVTKGGNLIPVALTLSPIRDGDCNVIGISKIARDISKSKKAENVQLALSEDLRRSNAELAQFASVVSHDLQEPLRGVAGCLQLIEDYYKGKGDDKVDKLVRHAIDGALRMHALIGDLLALSRVTIEETTIVPTDLSLVLDRAIGNLETPIKESRAVITHDSLPSLPVDSTHLCQVFQNLISNAIKFRSDANPNIHIGAKYEDGYWLFSVKDNGIGFKQEFADRIFLPFNRLHTREKYPGTGIGLAICKRIIERHKGKIWVESTNGQGTTFYFTINEPED